MLSIKNIARGGLLVCISAVLQLLPASFGEIFVIATILSSVPIYILSRTSPKTGFIGYIISGVIIFLFNVHEGLFFIFTNGIVGFSLGIFSYKLKSKLLIVILSGIALTMSLSAVNYIAGIPVLGFNIPGTLPVQICILLVFSVIYNFIYLHLADYIYTYLKNLMRGRFS